MGVSWVGWVGGWGKGGRGSGKAGGTLRTIRMEDWGFERHFGREERVFRWEFEVGAEETACFPSIHLGQGSAQSNVIYVEISAFFVLFFFFLEEKGEETGGERGTGEAYRHKTCNHPRS